MKNYGYWSSLTPEMVYKELHSSEQGLSKQEARQRLAQYGKNEISTRVETIFTLLARQFRSPFNYLLIIAALIAFISHDLTDTLLIAIFTLINIALGFYQEYKAHRVMLLLKKFIPENCHVVRDNKIITINKSELVPGDVVELEAGMVVPADMRITKTTNVLVDEAVLTGESMPINKDAKKIDHEIQLFEAKNIVFAGTTIMGGSGLGIVFATGNNTEFHHITIGGQDLTRISGYEKNLLRLSYLILYLVVGTILLILGIKVLLAQTIKPADFILFALALIITIIPEALPTVVAFSLSQAAAKLARNHLVVKRLSSVQDLGNIQLLCIDKTGTITETYLMLDNVISSNKEKTILYATIGQGAAESGPFEGIITHATTPEIDKQSKEYTDIKSIPFESFRMRSSVLVQDKQKNRILIVKGAPESLLSISTASEGGEILANIEKQAIELGQTGKRIFAIAYKKFDRDDYDKDDEKDLIFLGFFSCINPLKKGTQETIHFAQKLGVQVKMITGDSKEVAEFVGKQVGLIKSQEDAILGKDLAKLQDEEFISAVNKYTIFSRVDPELKAQIIIALQKSHEVGFLGEGINDVPALKTANVAIVVQGAADIARAYADIILLHRDLRVILEGIHQGRVTFANIDKYLRWALSSNFGNYYSLAFISLFIKYLPMLPVQILFLNILSDFPLIAVSSDTVDVSELRRPKRYQLKKELVLIALLALINSLSDFVFFGIFYNRQPDMVRTLWVIENMLTQIVLIFSIRTFRPFYKAKRPGKALTIISIFTVLICLILPYTYIGHRFFSFTPPTFGDLAIIFGITVGYFVVSETIKLLYVHYQKKHGNL